MKQVGWLISRYLVSTIVPYFVFSWLLLSVILFVQQASRYSDIFFSVNIPANLIWQLTVALVPNVIAFTCPMAMLVGTIIGLTKMQGDSELVAIRAAGVGNLQVALPIVALGIVMSGFAFFVNLEGVPLAASLVRSVALQTAIKKLESPIEPGVFNTEVNGYTIYVKGGDLETRTWKNIFIYNEDAANKNLRLITSRNGRIDTTGQQSELVLENATVSTLPLEPGAGKYVSENISDLRVAIKTKRNEIVERLSLQELRPEELGLQQLSEYATTKDGIERTEAHILWQRRIILSVTPLIFCLLGTVIVLRFNRGGRGFGIAVALGVLVGFYLLTFLGEQLARVGAISVLISGLIPIAGSLAAIIWLSFSRKLHVLRVPIDSLIERFEKLRKRPEHVQTRNVFMDLTTGLRDFDLIFNLVANFSFTLLFLSAIFMIFTAFELWKFAGTIDGGVYLLGKYLFYLLPFIYLQISPSAAMIATLATYVIKSRNNEIVTWTSAGQSVYRLLVPCFLLTILLGAGNWLIQEKLLPVANQRQDEARSLIRNRGVPVAPPGKYWVANEKRIYSFEYASDNVKPKTQAVLNKNASDNAFSDKIIPEKVRDTASDNEIAQAAAINSLEEKGVRQRELSAGRLASDNVLSPAAIGRSRDLRESTPLVPNASDVPGNRLKRHVRYLGSFGMIAPVTLFTSTIATASDNEKRVPGCMAACVKGLIIYEFADNGERLQAVYRADRAEWGDGKVRFIGEVERNDLRDGKITTIYLSNIEIAESVNPFAELRAKPNQLNTPELKRQLDGADSEVERRNLSVGLQKKYTTLFMPLVMALFTAPFALSLSRTGKAATVGYAVMLWLLFTGISTTFEQIGLNGLLSPELSVWSPLLIFTFLGVFLLSKVRT